MRVQSQIRDGLLKKQKFFSLRTKLILVLSGIIMGVGSGLSWYFIQQQIEVMFGSLMKTGDLLVRNLAYNSRYSLLTEDEPLLQQLVEGALQVEEVVYVVMMGPDGHPLVSKSKGRLTDLHSMERSHGFPVFPPLAFSMKVADLTTQEPVARFFRVGQESESDSPKPVNEMQGVSLFMAAQGEGVYDFSVPVWRHQSDEPILTPLALGFNEDLEETMFEPLPRIYGVVQIGMSSASMQKRLNEIIINVILITILIILVGIMATVMLANRIIMPLRVLTLVAKRVMTGDLSALVQPSTHDEVGQLTDIFNKMTRSLADQQQRLENLVAHLPSGVFLMSPDRLLVLVNPTGRDQLVILGDTEVGEPLEQLGDLSLQGFLPDTVVEKPYHEICLKGPPSQTFEVTARKVPTGLEAGGWLIVVRETTAQKVAEDALRKSERRLRKVLAEREELGRDLHDGTLQSLYAVGLGLEVVKPLMKEDYHDASQQLNQSITQLNTVMKTIRNFISGATFSIGEKADFEVALRSLVTDMTSAHPTNFSVQCDRSVTGFVTKGQHQQLLNIIREAISNCLKHAKASHGEITLQLKDSTLLVEVIDDGIGFSWDHLSRSGHGLENMQARARQMGGKLKIVSNVGQGTRIILTISQEDFDGTGEYSNN